MLAAAGIVLGAIAWGGGTTPTAQAAVLGAMGALFLLVPASHRLPRGFAWLALAWLALGAVTFLPATWFGTPGWRVRFGEAGVVLPSTLTPQPALTVHALVWLFAGLAWIGWLAPAPDSRRITMRVLALGMVGIATVALIAWAGHWRVPGWLSQPSFGPFPNRNHTGHVLALGGILALGCAMDAARRKTWRAVPWIIGALVIGAALVVNYSRGGVLLLLGAGGLGAAIAAWQRRSWKIATLAAAVMLAGAATVLLSGHALAGRFTGGADSQIAFRALIWKDTLAMVDTAPWCGDGLGNFRQLFPVFREASVIQQAVWHPESDWLWVAAEMSWLGVVLAAVILAVMARGAWPFARGTQRQLRLAAFAGAIGAAGHALIDVPAHRPGSALLALMMLALARNDVVPNSMAAMRWMWRAVGLALIGAAVWFSRTGDDLARSEALLATRDWTGAKAAADRAIQHAPLDWRGYYARAAAEAHQGAVLSAIADFRRARLLEPQQAVVPVEEGRVWARIIPSLAFPAWSDALQRVGPPEDEDYFGRMLRAAPNDAAFRARMLTLTEGRPNLREVWRKFVPAGELGAAER